MSYRRVTVPLLFALVAFYVGTICHEFFRCSGPLNDSWANYVGEGYRLRYPKSWKVRGWPGELYLCSPRIKFPCGPTPHEVYATVAVYVRDTEELELIDYLRSPALGYKNLREVQIGGVGAFATGPVNGDFGRFIHEEVHILRGGRIYEITAYGVDSCPSDFEHVLTTFEFTK